MRFVINKKNQQNLPSLASFLAKNSDSVGLAVFSLTKEMKKYARFSDFVSFLANMSEEGKYSVLLENFPFCSLPEQLRQRVFWKEGNKKVFQKSEKCRNCAFFERCKGFPMGYLEKFGEDELKPIADLPTEIMLEVETKCNFNCKFCFNQKSFAKNGRKVENISSEKILTVLDQMANFGIKKVRFTGGEPLLRKDIFQLCSYAKDKGLIVALNTNGALVNKENSKKIAKYVDSVLISLESGDGDGEDLISGNRKTLEKKIQAIRLLKEAKTEVVRIGTVFSVDGICNFEKIAKIAEKEKVYSWEWYRPMGGKKIKKKDLEKLEKNILDFRKKSKIPIVIANPLPFCIFGDKNRLNLISHGAIWDEGNSRMVLDPREFFKPDYFINKDLGNFEDISKAWNNEFMQKMRNLKNLPKKCEECHFKEKCRGGSRYEAFLAFGKWNKNDPLV